MTEQEKFEAWWKSNCVYLFDGLQDDDGNYEDGGEQWLWECWQAASAERDKENDIASSQWRAWQSAAAESEKEVEQLQKELNHWKCNHDHQVSLKQKIEKRRDLIEEPLHKEIEQLRERLRVCREFFSVPTKGSLDEVMGMLDEVMSMFKASYEAALQACKDGA